MFIDCGDDLGSGHRAAVWWLCVGCAAWSCSCGEGGPVPTAPAALAAAALHQVASTLAPV